MKNRSNFQAALAVALAAATSLVACAADDTTPQDEASETGTTDPTTTTTTSPTTSTTNPTTTTTTSETETTETTMDPETTSTESSSTGDDPFVFPEEPYSDYTQIDRHGAVEAGTAGIAAASGLGLMGKDIAVRDDYNASNPVEDADGDWLAEITVSVDFFHDALDDDLMMLGLTPATVNEALAQAGPVIVPDTIKYDPAMATGYPNGRALEDQVVDITLAAVLLDLGVHPLDTFASLPLNPAENDVPFDAEFPYLAPPHNP